MTRKICAGPLPPSDCGYYVSWDAYVILGEDWINVYGGGYSIAGGRWSRLGEALILPPAMEAQGYQGFNYPYFKTFGAVKLNPQSGGGYTLYGLGGLWGAPMGKTQAEPNEFPFFTEWSPKEGQMAVTDIRFNFGGTLANTDYYINFDKRCNGLPNFSKVSCSPPTYSGNAAPPPPQPRKKMSCCDCNTISTIIAENTIIEVKQHEATRNHIDLRTIECLREINKMLQGMEFNINLQPVIDRLNELEANLWNGLNSRS